MTEDEARSVAERYEGLLLDAFGVLVDSHGPVAGAPEFVAWLEAQAKPFVVLTNDASRLPERVSDKLSRAGIRVAPDRISTSGELLAPFFRREGLVGARCVVLGPPDSFEYVRRAGGEPMDHRAARDATFDVLVIGDESGYPFLEAIDDVLGPLVAAFEDGHPPRLVVPNPDLVYPKPDRGLGLASGGVASIFETVLAGKLPDRPPPRFIRLGKPEPTLFEAGRRRLGVGSVVMFGDTPATDIAGAQAAGIDGALVLTGVTRSWDPARSPSPRWVIRTLSPPGLGRSPQG